MMRIQNFHAYINIQQYSEQIKLPEAKIRIVLSHCV
jgi:hypothetical protein